MRKVIFAILLFGFYACSETPQNAEVEDSTEEVVVETVAMNFYGDTIDPNGAISPTELYIQMEGKDTMEVMMAATINETCPKKGCWMTLDMGNGEEMRVRFKDYGFFVPTEGLGGKTATVKGIAFTDTVSVDYLRHYAEDANASEEEIAAITEPEIRINFEATGVVIE